MTDRMVVGLDLKPDWFEKKRKVMSEIEKQINLGLFSPGKGLTLEHLVALVEHRNPFEVRGKIEVKDPELKVWKTIKLGRREIRTLAVGMSAIQNLTATSHLYIQALESKKFRIGDYARQILDKVTVAPTETEIDLAVLTVADLGFKRATRYDVICKRIVEVGAQLCPAEVGPALRLAYDDQPAGEYNAIAMEPLTDSVGFLYIFYVRRDVDERWLSTYIGRPDRTWHPVSRFVVVVPRK